MYVSFLELHMSSVEKQNLTGSSCASGLLWMCFQGKGSEANGVEQRKNAKQECGVR